MKAKWLWSLIATCASAANGAVVTVTLNQLEIGIDEATGSLVSLSSPHLPQLLSAEPAEASVLDVAYPLESFAPMRLASRHSKARIERGRAGVKITWEALGASRPNMPLPAGNVRAEVTIRAADDGRSVIFRARIDNQSVHPVSQVLFPDLWGLRPAAGAQHTRLRLAREVVYPFRGPVTDPLHAPFYARPTPGPGISWQEFPAGSYYEANALRWLDYGGFQGGLSVFQKKWGTYDWPDVITRRSERDPSNLRMAWAHKQEIAPGGSWDSGEFWFTPHPGGWAKGIEVYRDYVRQVAPRTELPRHVREDIGYQTIWMIQTAEADPARARFRYADLPAVAADARRHGIHEIVAWGWNTYSTMPIPIREELGTTEDLLTAVRKSRELGVNITPFISISIVRNRFAERYGVQPANDDWTYHYELIPMFRPYYTRFWNGVEINSNNPTWQADALAALEEWIGRGITSFSWDVFRVHPPETGSRPPLLSLVDRVRRSARAADPESVFSGESVTHLEFDSQALDYLWNWNDYEDAAPITSVLPQPRVSCNVEKAPIVVAKCFADNLYINVMPREPDAPNGTALISSEPPLARALVHAAQLRKQFLPYFVEGTFIGDSVLTAPANGFVRGYVMQDRLLVIVLNDSSSATTVDVRTDLGLWLPGKAAYSLTEFDANGAGGRSRSTGRLLAHTAGPLEPGELAILEIVGR